MVSFQKSDNISFLETPYVTMFIQDGIYEGTFRPLKLLDLDIAITTVQDRLAFFKTVAYPCLFDVTAVQRTTKEARDYMANEGNQLVLASAMVVSSPMLKMMANFYIMVNKPKNPTRLFTERESGIEWLRGFRNTF